MDNANIDEWHKRLKQSVKSFKTSVTKHYNSLGIGHTAHDLKDAYDFLKSKIDTFIVHPNYNEYNDDQMPWGSCRYKAG